MQGCEWQDQAEDINRSLGKRSVVCLQVGLIKTSEGQQRAW